MDKRSTYVVQPFKVGSKKGNSLALIIPSEIVKGYDINTSTVFALRTNEKTRTVMFQTINDTVIFGNYPAIPKLLPRDIRA
jgi:hypothetical protein